VLWGTHIVFWELIFCFCSGKRRNTTWAIIKLCADWLMHWENLSRSRLSYSISYLCWPSALSSIPTPQFYQKQELIVFVHEW
jgi:hypothetical protein